jgi:hemolysin III
VLIYLLMGWLVVIAFKPLLSKMPRPGMLWLLAGGLSYTLGVIFYVWKKLPYHHAVWHLFVLAGGICHYFAILFYVLP